MQGPVKQWLSSGNHFTFKGHSIYYRQSLKRGKPAVLLIHGFPTSSYDFAPIWGELAKKYTVITADMIGFGFSAKPLPHDYSIIEQADLFESIAEATQGKRIPCARTRLRRLGRARAARPPGWQKETRAVGELSERRPLPRISQTFAHSETDAHASWAIACRFFTKKKLRKTFDSIFGDNKATEADLEAFWQLIEMGGGRRVIPHLLRYMIDRRTHRERWVNAMESTLVPVQMINGPLDPISGAHLAEAFRKRNPRAEVISLPGVGHYPQVEAPAEVVKVYLSFLARGRPQPRSRKGQLIQLFDLRNFRRLVLFLFNDLMHVEQRVVRNICRC
jgi:pimeloyl-ACP methyl ester carboxylesterase